VESFVQHVQHTQGKHPSAATTTDHFISLARTARDRMYDRWTRTWRERADRNPKQVYYLSLEFLVGRLLEDGLMALGIYDDCKQGLADVGLDISEILGEEHDAGLGNGGLGRLAACFIDSMATWVQDWPPQAREWQGEDGASVAAFELGSLPAGMQGTADAVLAVRALHNLARFENDGNYLTTALGDVFEVLKPGGIVGIVQHKARDEMPDDWAGGAAGYLKEQFVIDAMTAAGFEFVSSSDINENPKDQPTTDDIVWRLPPSLQTSADDEALRAQLAEIGESNRMTLMFRKPENGSASAGGGT